jgi:hypothetical protein
MRDIRIGAAQFEARDADKAYNLSCMETLIAQAVARGAEIVSFRECCITGYTLLMTLSRSDLVALAESIPEGGESAAEACPLPPSNRERIMLGEDSAILGDSGEPWTVTMVEDRTVRSALGCQVPG